MIRGTGVGLYKTDYLDKFNKGSFAINGNGLWGYRVQVSSNMDDNYEWDTWDEGEELKQAIEATINSTREFITVELKKEFTLNSNIKYVRFDVCNMYISTSYIFEEDSGTWVEVKEMENLMWNWPYKIIEQISPTKLKLALIR